MNKKRILLISSSTGGHALPVFQLAKELSQHSYKVIIAHTDSAIEREVFSGFRSHVIRSGKTNTNNAAKTIFEYIKVIYSAFLSAIMLIKERPNLIISKGGFNAVPILFCAKIFIIPYFVHESDIVMGRSNGLFARGAKKIFVSFPKECYLKKYPNMIYSGLIIRDFPTTNRHTGGMKKILIIGGSQGARALSDTIIKILPELLSHYIVVHSTGLGKFGAAAEIISKLPADKINRYIEFSFSYSKLESEMIDADLIISRAGANAIGEIAKLGKPSIIVPYPYAASDHQVKNAKYLEKVGATILIKQELLRPDTLLERINLIMSDERNSEVLGRNIKNLIKTDGAKIIVQEINRYFGAK